MKKSALLLCLFCVVAFSSVFAQKNKSEKKQRKEFLDLAIPECIEQMNGDGSDAGITGAVNAKGYCTCMLENLIEKYTLADLSQMFVNKDKSEMMMSFFEDNANYSKTMECMRNNVKDEKAMKTFVLQNSFGLENCTQSLSESGLDEQIKAEDYCVCMFQRLEKEFTLDEILDEATYESEKFKVMALECVMANTIE